MIAAVAAGAALGGVARLLLTQAVLTRWGTGSAFAATAFINIGGSFLIGLVAETAHLRSDFPPILRVFLATGILGGYTTFSTLSLETLGFIGNGSMLAAAAYAAGSVTLGVLAAYGGTTVARLWS